ncbi:hypothetical protein [Herbidospora cretacea]|uniref:hypothetical protein n=1 Tax=Herbidospora cretacea TaxID=28444 RepID=UPI000774DEDB|nr:hypothetical protein [Herbidospora cretacea]
MSRRALVAVAVAVTGLSACTAKPEPVVASSPAARQVLLDAAQLPGGPWTAGASGDTRWADLDEAMVPCGKRDIAPAEARVRFRVFEAAGGASVSELVVSGTDVFQTFKRFYAECSSTGKVESRPGPANLVRRGDTTEVAVFTEDHLIVVSGTGADAGAIADAARAQAAKAG